MSFLGIGRRLTGHQFAMSISFPGEDTVLTIFLGENSFIERAIYCSEKSLRLGTFSEPDVAHST